MGHTEFGFSGLCLSPQQIIHMITVCRVTSKKIKIKTYKGTTIARYPIAVLTKVCDMYLH